MKFITKDPSMRLKNLIKQMWVVEENGLVDVSVESFPVGYSFINVIDGHNFRIRQENQDTAEYRSYLAGSKCSSFNLHMSFIRRALTIQLQPYAVPLLFSIPAGEFHNQVLPISDFNPSLARQLEHLVRSDLSSDRVLNFTERILTALLGTKQADNRVQAALSILMNSQGQISISALADEVNLSQRRLQQLFKHYFGMTAKSYCRIIKIQYHTYQWLHGIKLDSAIPDGYFDQSHFIHELKNQTGMLPGEFYDYITRERIKQAYVNTNLYHKSRFI